MPCDNTEKTNSEIENVDWSTGGGSGHHYANVRFGSSSSQASQSSGDICRICHCESDPQNPLLTPCYCAGSLKYVHQACLQQWLTASETNSCELCKFPFIMHTKIKPFNEWRSLDISGIERRRLCCSVLFHCAAALCVIWSLCVLIERAADDVQRGLIDWPFWTKLAVVTVGLTGGVVFMYIQCKAYLHLCHRWKARNRILLIQNAPEKVHPLSPPSPAVHRSRGGGCISEPRIAASSGAASSGGGGCALEIGGAGVATASNACNYVTAAGVAAGIGSSGGQMEVVDGVAALHHHHHRHHHHHHHHHDHLSSSPHHMLQQVDDLEDPLTVARLMGGVLAPHHLTGGGGVGGGSGGSADGGSVAGSHQLGQVAVSANIECSQSQHNYERDWALDNDVVSQISSFRPCPQGSGSMTPFHDSIHNVLEHSSETSSRGSVNDMCGGSRQDDLSTGGVSSDTGREHAMQLSSFSGSGDHKAPSISSGVSNAVANGLGGFVYKPHTKRYSNSSIFLENRDILNDSVALSLDAAGDYPKMNYRHSGTLTTPPDGSDGCLVGGRCSRSGGRGSIIDDGDSDQLEKFLGKDLRRYSDTKLLASGGEAEALFNTPHDEGATAPASFEVTRTRRLMKQHSAAAATATDTVLDMELPTSPLSPPAVYAYPGGQQRHAAAAAASLHRSMHTVDEGGGADAAAGAAAAGASAQQIDKARLFFKSLPNLSSSCESLIKK